MKWLGRKFCSLCGEPNERACSYCKECKSLYMRMKRPKYSDMSESEKFKSRVRSLANAALKRGEIQYKPCECCGSDDSQMHHEDYSKPLEVIWLCRPCHLKVHDPYQRNKILSKIEQARSVQAISLT